MADFTNRNADETKEFILTFDENGGSPEYTKIEDANGVDRTAEVVELLGINDKEDADPTILKEGDVEDSLNSTSTTKPLSANQGKQLNDDKASLSAIITDHDRWLLTSPFSGSSEPIDSNLSRSTLPTFTKKGDGMSFSSGIFSFPKEGLWKVDAHATFRNETDTEPRARIQFDVTNNNSDYNTKSATYTNIKSPIVRTDASVFLSFVLNVGDINSVKCRFLSSVENSNTETLGKVNQAELTFFTFTRLGDI